MTTPTLTHGTVDLVWFITVELGPEDDDCVRRAVSNAVALNYGAYDHVAFESTPGTQYFRPRAGSVMGSQDVVHTRRARQLTFSIPRDDALIAAAIDAVMQTHSYEEPVIYIDERAAVRADYTRRSRDSARWWNAP